MDLFDVMDNDYEENYLNLNRGIRLKKLEVRNWGTFDKHVFKFTPDGYTSLLTGQSGSGKSTIVDALTTLLVSPRKVSYNKAADASARERTTRSYVLGHYGRKYDADGKGKQESLRDENSYSVILATFEDKVNKKIITIVIFFYFKPSDNTPTKIYAVSDEELFISKHFCNFNSNVRVLKDNLKKQGAQVFDDFSRYSEFYRKKMNGLSEQAIDLFQQTISVKKVENLNEFVRSSMLEKDDMNEQIDKIIKHYENLNAAYEAVLKAKEKISKLKPISNNGEKYEKLEEQRKIFDQASTSIEYFFASKSNGLYEEKITNTRNTLNQLELELNKTKERKDYIEEEKVRIISEIGSNGGNEIERLEDEIRHKNADKNRRIDELNTYNANAKLLGISDVTSSNIFLQNQSNLSKLERELDDLLNVINQELTKVEIKLNDLKNEKSEYDHEILSLSKRRSNIPRYLIELREQLCEHLRVSEELLPFAGELLEVREEELKWEGAIERLIGGFGISLLVTSNLYPKVLEWVNNRSLGKKLVYYRVNEEEKIRVSNNKDVNSVATKLDVKQNTTCTKWLSEEIYERFSHICCEDINDFKRNTKALSLTGQIKSGDRHVKDDSKKLNDRSRYILGFSNEKKLNTMRQLSKEINDSINLIEKDRNDFISERSNLNKKQNALSKIVSYDDYSKLDVDSIIKIILEHENRIKELQNTNDKLKQLRLKKDELDKESKELEKSIGNLYTSIGGNKTTISNLENKKNLIDIKLENENDEIRLIYSFLEGNFEKYLGDVRITVDNTDDLEKKYKEELVSENKQILEKINKVVNKIEKSMEKYIIDYPSETTDFTSNIGSLFDFNNVLKELEFHNLPKFQENFRTELHSKILSQMLLFSSQLTNNSDSIRKRIDEINESLHTIEYNPGRHITLRCEATKEIEIADFRKQLKNCIEGSMSDDNSEVELQNKFLEIQGIIGRFKGRETYTTQDKNWTSKVTDVRNWYVFSASEKWTDTNEEYEHYSDSDGKSGGQKEKLAYTILAASLSYNYKLVQSNNSAKPSFRLVVIDEAFLKSSDEAATYGLNLFKELDFQLIVVTPLLKIRTIEPFISRIGFVTHSDKDHKSKLSDLSIETYKERRKEVEDKYIG